LAGRLGGHLVVAVMALTLVTGCGVKTNGLTGIAVDDSGELLVALAWCGRQPDILTVYHDSPSNTTDPNITDVSFQAPKLSSNLAEVNVEHPGGGWAASATGAHLDQSAQYYAGAGTKDNARATRQVAFYPTVTAKLKPGQVFLQDADNNSADIIIPEADFAKRAARLC
jgi:hypothetical protein